MMNSNNSTYPAAKSTVTVELEPVDFPTTKRSLSPDFTPSILTDMRKSASQSTTRLSLGDSKKVSDPDRLSYSTAFSLPAQMPGQLPANIEKRKSKAVSTAKQQAVPPATSSRTLTHNAAPTKSDECSCSLTPCARKEENTAMFPQAEALSTIMAGQAVNFGEALFNESTIVGHPVNTGAFLIQETGIYELHYSLNYEVSAPCTLILGFENFPQSHFKQPITYAPARGKLKASVRLLLEAGTILRLVLLEDPAAPSIQNALVSNALLEIKQLYRLTVSCPNYSDSDPKKNFRSENSFVQKPVPNISSRA